MIACYQALKKTLLVKDRWCVQLWVIDNWNEDVWYSYVNLFELILQQ